jgi:hypothetical protein
MRVFRKAHLFGIACCVIAVPACVQAAGYENGGGACCGFAAQTASAIKAVTSMGGTSSLRVLHTDQATALAVTTNSERGATATGHGNTQTATAPGLTVESESVTVQRGNATVNDASTRATSSSATLLKVRASDGSFYVYKGMASAGAAVGLLGPSTSTWGFARSISGQR